MDKRKQKTVSENEISPKDYRMSFLKGYQWAFIIMAFFILGITLNFPLNQIVKSQVEKAIAQALPNCTIKYKELAVSLFPLPSVAIKKADIPGYCFALSRSINVDSLELNFRGIGIIPFGPKFYLNFNAGKMGQGNVYFTVSLGGTLVLRVEETKLNLAKISELDETIPELSGQLAVESLISISKMRDLKDLQLLITSTDFEFPEQNVVGFDVPYVPIKNLLVKAKKVSSKKIDVQEIIIGDEKSPIVGTFAGNLRLSKSELMNSEMSIKGEVKFSDSFIKTFSFLPIIMKKFKFKAKNGFYQIKIEGPLHSPKPVPL